MVGLWYSSWILLVELLLWKNLAASIMETIYCAGNGMDIINEVKINCEM